MSGRRSSTRSALEPVVAWFHEVDRRFSLFRPDSEASRVAGGRAPPRRRQPGRARDRDARRRGQGSVRRLLRRPPASSRRPPRPHGDREGLVRRRGHRAASASPEPATPRWPPAATSSRPDTPRPGARGGSGSSTRPSRDSVAAVLGVRDLAVATSGPVRARRAHPRPAHRPRAADLRSMTVVGPTLALADAFATAAFAMGERGIAWIARQPGTAASPSRGTDASSGRRWSTRSSLRSRQPPPTTADSHANLRRRALTEPQSIRIAPGAHP